MWHQTFILFFDQTQQREAIGEILLVIPAVLARAGEVKTAHDIDTL